MTAPSRPPAPRSARYEYVVRDAAGRVRNRGRSKRDALAPYKALVNRAQRPRRDDKPMTLKKQTLWLYLFRRGWTCTKELSPTTPRMS